ncbi:MAG: hypothetical protein L3J74_12415, partial [Bacteroidales bacterium]|nr:hypothetical protein [Bacteroidales bacterium]
EQNELNQLIENLNYLQVFKKIQKTKLNAPNVIFKHKQVLKRKHTKIFFSLKTKFLYRAAALTLLLISLTFLFKQDKQSAIYNVSLLKIKEIPNREVNAYQKNNSSLAFVNKTDFTEIKPDDIIRKKEKEPVLIKSKTVNRIMQENQQKIKLTIAQNNGKKFTPENKRTNKQILSKQKAIWKIKKAGKTIVYTIAYSLRKNFRYKKQYLDDGKVLIALKAGEFEYQKLKEVKKP